MDNCHPIPTAIDPRVKLAKNDEGKLIPLFVIVWFKIRNPLWCSTDQLIYGEAKSYSLENNQENYCHL